MRSSSSVLLVGKEVMIVDLKSTAKWNSSSATVIPESNREGGNGEEESTNNQSVHSLKKDKSNCSYVSGLGQGEEESVGHRDSGIYSQKLTYAVWTG